GLSPILSKQQQLFGAFYISQAAREVGHQLVLSPSNRQHWTIRSSHNLVSNRPTEVSSRTQTTGCRPYAQNNEVRLIFIRNLQNHFGTRTVLRDKLWGIAESFPIRHKLFQLNQGCLDRARPFVKMFSELFNHVQQSQMRVEFTCQRNCIPRCLHRVRLEISSIENVPEFHLDRWQIPIMPGFPNFLGHRYSWPNG